MADEKISELANASALGGTEEFPVTQGGDTKAASVNQLGTFFAASFQPLAAYLTTLAGRSDATLATALADETAFTGTFVAQATFTEDVQDVAGGMVTGNTETGIAVTYDDGTGKFNFDAQTAGDARYAPLASASAVVENTQTGTTYTLVLTDAGKVVRCTNASAVTLTVPLNSSVAFATGTIINVYSGGAGGVTIAPTGGVTIRNNSTGVSQYGEVSLRKDGTDEWVRVG